MAAEATSIWQDAEGFVRAGLEWLSKHYEHSGSSRWKYLPAPDDYFDLVLKVGEALGSWDDALSSPSLSRDFDAPKSAPVGPESAS